MIERSQAKYQRFCSCASSKTGMDVVVSARYRTDPGGILACIESTHMVIENVRIAIKNTKVMPS